MKTTEELSEIWFTISTDPNEEDYHCVDTSEENATDHALELLRRGYRDIYVCRAVKRIVPSITVLHKGD